MVFPGFPSSLNNLSLRTNVRSIVYSPEEAENGSEHDLNFCYYNERVQFEGACWERQIDPTLLSVCTVHYTLILGEILSLTLLRLVVEIGSSSSSVWYFGNNKVLYCVCAKLCVLLYYHTIQTLLVYLKINRLCAYHVRSERIIVCEIINYSEVITW